MLYEKGIAYSTKVLEQIPYIWIIFLEIKGTVHWVDRVMVYTQNGKMTGDPLKLGAGVLPNYERVPLILPTHPWNSFS